VHGWHGPGIEFADANKRRLDWGAVLYEVSKEEVLRLAWEPEWLAESGSARAQRELLAGLSDDERYGVVFIEAY
jgi:hypothetical protein